MVFHVRRNLSVGLVLAPTATCRATDAGCPRQPNSQSIARNFWLQPLTRTFADKNFRFSCNHCWRAVHQVDSSGRGRRSILPMLQFLFAKKLLQTSVELEESMNAHTKLTYKVKNYQVVLFP